jgi:4-hydroxy-tetrahydrodipicolinate synthase
MANPRPSGVFAAALTPVKPDGSLDLENVLPYLEFLANRGCNGTLLFGTTGEGPSFSPAQRIALGRVATQIHATHPDFMLLMGTGTPSLTETIELSRAAFEIGMQGVVVLPPYFNRQASEDGLCAWFSQVIHQAVPSDGFLLGYHIPQMTGVSLTLPLIDRLKTAFPIQFAGIKNSWTDPKLTTALGNQFGADLVVMTGFDQLVPAFSQQPCLRVHHGLSHPGFPFVATIMAAIPSR